MGRGILCFARSCADPVRGNITFLVLSELPLGFPENLRRKGKTVPE